MKINDIWNEFLELRKSPAMTIFALIGLMDLIVMGFLLLANLVLILTIIHSFFQEISFGIFMLWMLYICLRIPGLPYYMSIIGVLFITEKIFKFKINMEFINNSKKYKILWIIGFFAAIIFTMLIPIFTNRFKYF